MSELKDYDIMDIEAMDDERLEKSESGKIQATRVYIKSEADKVIAELEESHKMEVEQLLMEIVELKGQYKDMDVTHTVHIAKMNAMIEELEESHKMEVEQLLMEIAELKAFCKEACDRLQTANLIKDEQLAATRHQKYKRCLAMARWCKCKRIDAADYRIPREKWEFYDKWYKRWLKIAEQFKEAK